jgi:hypothetical protein
MNLLLASGIIAPENTMFFITELTPSVRRVREERKMKKKKEVDVAS